MYGRTQTTKHKPRQKTALRRKLASKKKSYQPIVTKFEPLQVVLARKPSATFAPRQGYPCFVGQRRQCVQFHAQVTVHVRLRVIRSVRLTAIVHRARVGVQLPAAVGAARGGQRQRRAAASAAAGACSAAQQRDVGIDCELRSCKTARVHVFPPVARIAVGLGDYSPRRARVCQGVTRVVLVRHGENRMHLAESKQESAELRKLPIRKGKMLVYKWLLR